LSLAGSGALHIAAAASQRHRALEILREAFEPDARNLARLAVSLAPIANLAPLYIRAPDAKPQTQPSLRSPS
jgi:hypothetical protein